MRRLLLAFLAAAPLLPSARPALATTVIATDLKELSRTANVIVHGRVVNVRSQWTDDRRRIESLVAIEVLDSIKGAAGREVVVRVPGGQLGTLRSVMVGAPNFTAGEEVVLFLNGSAPAIPHLIGLGQSVYRVMTDRDTSCGRPGASCAGIGDAGPSCSRSSSATCARWRRLPTAPSPAMASFAWRRRLRVLAPGGESADRELRHVERADWRAGAHPRPHPGVRCDGFRRDDRQRVSEVRRPDQRAHRGAQVGGG
jgi:hypothetical protein